MQERYSHIHPFVKENTYSMSGLCFYKLRGDLVKTALSRKYCSSPQYSGWNFVYVVVYLFIYGSAISFVKHGSTALVCKQKRELKAKLMSYAAHHSSCDVV